MLPPPFSQLPPPWFPRRPCRPDRVPVFVSAADVVSAAAAAADLDAAVLTTAAFFFAAAAAAKLDSDRPRLQV